MQPPLQYERAREGIERFRRKTARSIIICRKNEQITGAASAADSDAVAGGGERHGSRAGEGAWHLCCHCEAGPCGARTSGEGKRTHGGAVPPGLTQHEDSFQQRFGEAVEAKKRLARAAATLLGADETVFIDSSTTAYYAARRMLAGTSGLTCLTNLVPVMDLFSTADPSGASMVGVGGIFRPLTLSFVGPCAIHTVESYMADRAFFERQGDHTRRASHGHQPARGRGQEGDDPASERPVLLVDGRKFERRGSASSPTSRR